jgi:hypothetical protein
MESMGKSCKTLVKCPADGPRSCTRTCRTLGHPFPAMRTLEERAHQRSMEGGNEMWCSGRRSGARATKTGAKAP